MPMWMSVVTLIAISEPWLSVIGGGLIAAIVTALFNICWDIKKSRLAEDWEYKRYKANLVHFSRINLMDVFFAAKSELEFLVGTLSTLTSNLASLEAQAEELVRRASGNAITVFQLDQQKNALMQPFKQYNEQQVQARWHQHGQKMQELQAKAESTSTTLRPLVPQDLFERIMALYDKLNEPWVWTPQNAFGRLKIYKEAVPEFQLIINRLDGHIDTQLGRKPERR